MDVVKLQPYHGGVRTLALFPGTSFPNSILIYNKSTASNIPKRLHQPYPVPTHIPTQELFFPASLSLFLNALLRIPSCIPMFCPTTSLFINPTDVPNAHCIPACAQYGVQVYANPCAPPLLPIRPNVALTKALGVGIVAVARRTFDMADVTR